MGFTQHLDSAQRNVIYETRPLGGAGLEPQLGRLQATFGLHPFREEGEPALSRNGRMDERKGKGRLAIVGAHTCTTLTLPENKLAFI